VHVVEVDPPAGRADVAHLRALLGTLHASWGEAERRFALAALAERCAVREPLKVFYRALQAGGKLEGAALRRAVGLNPERAARLARILIELGIAAAGPSQGAPEQKPGIQVLRVVSSEVSELERSPTYREITSRLEEGQQFLSNAKHP
ncbi:MAG TPA: hypothetical protein VFD37_02875, partial [Solirubrobacterales bacterium]|nr:hypothetical protein [Solirubrobacterales bacterium]